MVATVGKVGNAVSGELFTDIDNSKMNKKEVI